MTRAGKARWPDSSAIARAVRFAGCAGAVVLAGTAAMAQQGWEPTVSAGPAPPPASLKAHAPPPGRMAAPKPKPKSPLAAAISASDLMPEDRRSAAAAPATAALETGSLKGARAEEYCANIADPAADARFAWQKKMLADMEQEIAKRIALLEEKTAEYRKWLARRDEFSKKANETVLSIYSRMRPDAAAVQLAALDLETAASVLTKLEPRAASLILNEMEPAKAVRLTETISGAAQVTPAPTKVAPEVETK